MSTLALTLPRRYQPLHWTVGFFFAFRLCITFLWFQSDPQLGITITILCDLGLFACALFSRLGDGSLKPRVWLRVRTLRWIFAFLALSLASILWSSARSPIATLLYWASMAAEVFTVLLLVKHDPEEDAAAIMGGFVWGASVVALVAWFSPALPDLRLGNEDFLNPNGLGLQFAMASLCAQLLAARAGYWKWLSIALAITLLRTISKTSIVAYLAAETLDLVWGSHITRKAKLGIVAVAVIVVSLFSALLENYFAIYAATGNQVETLTGRTWVWATALSMAVERPLLGYGIYSFRAIIPAFGDFEPWHAHNEILQQFFEYGLVGLVILVGIYWSFYRTASRSDSSPLRTFSLALLLFALLHGTVDTVAFDLSFPLWLFAILSVAFAAQVSSRRPA
jgi:exopolysaccharide production protein ExoQ